jgi:hypothetical protein
MIFLLMRVGRTEYDRCRGFVVIANSETEARELVQEEVCWEVGTWSDPKLSTCEMLDGTGLPRIVLTSFRAG